MCPTVFQDNESIDDAETLYRRIHLVQLVPDGDTGLARISSGALKDREMSVHLGSALKRGPESCLEKYPMHRLVSFTAGQARIVEQAICRDPMPDDHSHGLVFGDKKGKVPDKLREVAEWVIPPGAPAYREIEEEKRKAGLLK